MEQSPQVEGRHGTQRAVQISLLVVLNIIWWMVMIAAIGVGVTHLGRCPVQPYIPIYLMVLGTSSLVSLSLTYSQTIWGDDGVACIMGSTCTVVLHLFSLGWFFAGNAWVYPVYPPDYTPGAVQYCDKMTYLFAFSLTTLVWVTLASVFICSCCIAPLICISFISSIKLIPNRYRSYGTNDSQVPTGGDE